MRKGLLRYLHKLTQLQFHHALSVTRSMDFFFNHVASPDPLDQNLIRNAGHAIWKTTYACSVMYQHH